MYKKVLKFMIIYIAVIFTLNGCAYGNPINEAPEAKEGILDLTNWKVEGDLIALDGQWEFYWEQLLEPQDFKNAKIKGLQLMDIPRAWNGYEVNGKTLSGDGHATYRLRIKTENHNELLGLKIPRILTSYKMWINEEPFAFAGQVGGDKDNMTPQYLTQIALFEPQEDEIEIVIQVSNYRHRSGGILESLSFGDARQVLHLRHMNIAYELFLFGSLLIMGLYHLVLFAFRKKEHSPLYFGLFCIFVAIRTLLVGEIFFIYLFPNFNWEIAHKVQTLTFYLGVPIFVMFLKSIYPKEVTNKILRINQGVGLAFGLLVLLTPAKVFTRFNASFQIFTLASIMYLIYVLVKIIYKKEIGARFIGVGALILLITTINDIIFLSVWMSDSNYHLAKWVIGSGNLSSFGQLVFVFTHSLALAKRFSNVLTKEEEITNYQRKLNERLEIAITDRTSALEKSNQKIQRQKSELEKANKALELLSSKDALTDIWNRRHFDEALKLEWRRGLRLKTPVALIFIDIDSFKAFNDQYGHQEGDRALKNVAQALKHSIHRSGDFVARYGGEEFVVILPNIEEDKAMYMAESLRITIEGLEILHEKSLVSTFLTVSLGVTTMIPATNSSPEELILAADKALYLAKDRGKNQAQFIQYDRSENSND
ncbi:7TM domain sensor diguanylate cyclase [Alkaliphilus metalliredigens QYMF]|uniref:7TM domain sensor diguanylate cyclase n=1 Tax=Alkaliphilus metalliredigens (strain QYMF) TaxID=293826 RepID=A6TWC4_ALKMQ|nr:diguanylate cyclase [Alkaliphilus metalliredigens]ABR50492.1 7TM domain sensor diguanylate cyclase [Alkaliphilus metalliredigens QYMF]